VSGIGVGFVKKAAILSIFLLYTFDRWCCRRERTMIGFMGNTTWLEKKLKRFKLCPLF